MPAAPSRLQLRAGSIKRVKLTDFMCHSELVVDFKTQVSFVTGHNGSGKSAILAAIVAGLGARANVTSRGAKLSDLIKHGEKSATVTISLHNEGTYPAPYAPEEFGDTIDIERVIHLEKSASYSIRSAKGKVISKKRKVLDEILDHFQIEVENPVFLMNQDTCRSFLNSKTGKELYGFFYKAPLLDNLEETVKTTRQKVEEGRAVVDQKVEEARPLEEAIATWRKKQEQCIRPENVEADIADAELKMRLREYHLSIRRAEAAEITVEAAEEEVHREEAMVVHNEAKIPRQQVRLQGMKGQKEAMTPEMAVSQKALDDSKPELRVIKQATIVAQQALNEAQDTVITKRRTLATFEQQLEVAKNQQDLRDLDDRKADLENQMQQARLAIEESRTNRNAFELEKKQLERQAEENRIAQTSFTNTYEAMRREIQELDSEINKHKDSGSGNGTLNRLGQLAVRQRAVVDGLVQRKVLIGGIIGPCAAQLSLTEQMYAKAVEKAVGAFSSTYILEDERDRPVVVKAFREQNVQAPTLDCALGSGKKFAQEEATFGDACRAPHPTVGDLLTFKHPHVRNVLVDALDLHRIVVMPTAESARKHYRDEAGFPNCKHILDIQGNHHSKDNDGYQFIPNSRAANTVSILSADFAAQISKLKNDRDAKVTVLKTKDAEKAEFTKKAHQLGESIRTKTDSIRKLQDDETKLQTRLTGFGNELDAVRSAQPTDIQALVDEVEEIRVAVAYAGEEIAVLETAFQKAKAKEAKADKNYNKMREQAKNEVTRVEELTNAIEKIELSIAEKESEVRNSKRTLSGLQNAVRQRQTEFEEATVNCERLKAQFLEEGVTEKRMLKKVTESQEQLEIYVDRLKASLRNMECDYENSWEYCRDKLEELTKQKMEIEAQLVQAKQAVELMDQNAAIREHNFLTSRAKSSEILRSCFEHLMQESASRYQGTIELDHNAKTLKFNVQAKEGNDNSGTGAGSNVKSLSGGERSYTMVCFLVALWQLIEIPFRVLDEFDVFMDMINRDTAMTRLIHSAVESQRQFIFLTPLAFSQEVLDDFKNNELVAIVRMPESRVMDDVAAQR